MEKFIIHQPWGGLGDNLMWSTIPEMCHLNNKECYISSRNATRNKEIHDLVWGSNPYVFGISDENPNAGTCKWPQNAGSVVITDSCIKKAEHFHGFEQTNKYPKIYYKHKDLSEVRNKTIVDFSSHNNSYNTKILSNYIKNNCKLDNLVQIKHKNSFNNNYILDKIDTIQIDSIFTYCDLISSCKEFICLYSGSSVLASAINKMNTKVFMRHGDDPAIYKNTNNIYMFDNLDYIHTDSWS